MSYKMIYIPKVREFIRQKRVEELVKINPDHSFFLNHIYKPEFKWPAKFHFRRLYYGKWVEFIFEI